MLAEYAWTENRYEKGNWCVTEIIEHNGKVRDNDWCVYKHSMETRIEAVAEILETYPNAKFDSWMDQWYLSDTSDYRHYFIIWNSDVYCDPWGHKWEEEA